MSGASVRKEKVHRRRDLGHENVALICQQVVFSQLSAQRGGMRGRGRFSLVHSLGVTCCWLYARLWIRCCPRKLTLYRPERILGPAFSDKNRRKWGWRQRLNGKTPSLEASEGLDKVIFAGYWSIDQAKNGLREISVSSPDESTIKMRENGWNRKDGWRAQRDAEVEGWSQWSMTTVDFSINILCDWAQGRGVRLQSAMFSLLLSLIHSFTQTHLLKHLKTAASSFISRYVWNRRTCKRDAVRRITSTQGRAAGCWFLYNYSAFFLLLLSSF